MKIIHVNRQLIGVNAKLGKPILPVYIVREGKKIRYGYGVEIDGPSRMADIRDHDQLTCGARAWIETDAPVRIIGEMSYAQARALWKKATP